MSQESVEERATYLSITQCPIHGYKAVNIEDKDGSGQRITPGKCCGRWSEVCRWKLGKEQWQELIDIIRAKVLQKAEQPPQGTVDWDTAKAIVTKIQMDAPKHWQEPMKVAVLLEEVIEALQEGKRLAGQVPGYPTQEQIDRYKNEPLFHNMVDMIVSALLDKTYTASQFREAIEFADGKVRYEHPDKFEPIKEKDTPELCSKCGSPTTGKSPCAKCEALKS